MNFNSVEFLIFLPIVLLGYWLLPHKIRWLWLLIASYVFYMSWNVSLIVLIMSTTLVSYAAAILMEASRSPKLKKLYLVITLIICLGCLIYFKYANFILESVYSLISLFNGNMTYSPLDILLPMGISFYTFQTLSYVIDVYRGDFRAEKHLGYYALYVAYFPQLVAGPIERPKDLLPQLRKKQRFSADDFCIGLRVTLVGFFRKVVVADLCAVYVNNAFSSLESANSLAVFIAGILFIFQMYNDFAGYSEIALGCAKMMGVNLTRNFDRPLLAVSYGEFFRRWHITLNRWFTDYVYIPLGGSRKGKPRKILNTLIVFLLCGLWHGANWTYAVWGLMAGTGVALETLLAKPVRRLVNRFGGDFDSPSFLTFRRLFLFFVEYLPAGLVFRAASLGEAGNLFGILFTKIGFGEAYFQSAFQTLGLTAEGVLLLVLAISSMALIYYVGEYARSGEPSCRQMLTNNSKEQTGAFYRRVSVYICIFMIIALSWLSTVSAGDSSGFVYFQF